RLADGVSCGHWHDASRRSRAYRGTCRIAIPNCDSVDLRHRGIHDGSYNAACAPAFALFVPRRNTSGRGKCSSRVRPVIIPAFRCKENFMSLSGRVALVSGASQGIGKACALKLAERGATVAVAARNEEKLKELVNHISGAGSKAAAFPMDVADEEQVKDTCKAVIAEFGKIDILVNNAGITRDQLVMRMKRADWDAVINTNLTSAYLCTQQVISAMLRQRWGRIVNVTSIFGQIGQTGQANYASSKAGLIGLTMAIAREVASRNITCNAVAPGFIETAMTAALPENLKQEAVKLIPLGRVGAPEDVANAVAFLASDEASYITGHVLNVNGGMLMG